MGCSTCESLPLGGRPRFLDHPHHVGDLCGLADVVRMIEEAWPRGKLAPRMWTPSPSRAPSTTRVSARSRPAAAHQPRHPQDARRVRRAEGRPARRAGARPAQGVTAIAIRAATDSDAGAMCLVYNQGMEDRIATLGAAHGRELATAARGIRVRCRSGGEREWSSLTSQLTPTSCVRGRPLHLHQARRVAGRGSGRRLLRGPPLIDGAGPRLPQDDALRPSPSSATECPSTSACGSPRAGVSTMSSSTAAGWTP